MTKAFLDRGREGHLGDAKRDRGRGEREDVRRRKMRNARTGQSNNSSGKDPTKSDKEGTQKERGRGRASDSNLALNSERYDRKASPLEKETSAATA